MKESSPSVMFALVLYALAVAPAVVIAIWLLLWLT